MNQKGYSWPEAILTVAVLLVIFGTLLPSATHITAHLQKKKFAMYASETLYRAAIVNQAYGQSEGSREVEGVQYEWQVIGSLLCTNYALYNEELEKCVETTL